MADGDSEEQASSGLSDEDTEKVAERRAGSAKVIHEVIRLQGEEELDRSVLSLLFSGFAAGVAISVSLLAQAFLKERLPDAPWATLVSAFGYSAGFVIVIMGNLQLFTESTVTAVLPVATRPTISNVGRLGKLWTSVFLANMAGTLFVAWLAAQALIVSAEQRQSMLDVAAPAMAHGPLDTLLLGMPGGFLIAAVAWVLPNAKGSEFWVIVFVTYVIAIGDFSHVVVGSAEAWLSWLAGRLSLADAVGGHIAPALLGNIIGGTGLFAVLAHGQVRSELSA